MKAITLPQHSLALLAGASFFAGAADAANLLVNGSFEEGSSGVTNPSDVVGWTGVRRLYNHPYNGKAGIDLAGPGGAQAIAATGNFDFNSLRYGFNNDVVLEVVNVDLRHRRGRRRVDHLRDSLGDLRDRHRGRVPARRSPGKSLVPRHHRSGWRQAGGNCP